ncbi:MAG: DnaD domain protein [Chloroflexi bacterium]|nr:DnaD domain protein [Chloroflexota bacterium]
MDEFFQGFEEGKKRFTGIPDQFFSEILPNIDDSNEIKLILYLLWSAYTAGDYGIRFTRDEILADKKFSLGLSSPPEHVDLTLDQSLKLALKHNILIEVKKKVSHYFINTPRGRAAAFAFGQQNAEDEPGSVKATLDVIKPNIFQLYEENIGPLTPLIADMLKDAQNSYPIEWIDEAIQIAVKNNVRRWKYVESILNRWQEEGRNGTDRRNTQEDYERYLKGEYGDIGKHW